MMSAIFLKPGVSHSDKSITIISGFSHRIVGIKWDTMCKIKLKNVIIYKDMLI